MHLNRTQLRGNLGPEMPNHHGGVNHANVFERIQNHATEFRMFILATLNALSVAACSGSEPEKPVDATAFTQEVVQGFANSAYSTANSVIDNTSEAVTSVYTNAYEYLLAQYCKILLNFSDFAECKKCLDGRSDEPSLNISEVLNCSTQWLYAASHPESIIGDGATNDQLEQYKAAKTEWANARKLIVRFGADELIQFIGKMAGKIDVFRLDEQMFSNHLAISRFLDPAVIDACNKAGLTPYECLIYKIVEFENSGFLWAVNEHSGATGPGQLMSMWVDPKRNNLHEDGLTTENGFHRSVSVGKKGARRTTFDGRLDPITNVELGARVIKYLLKVFGPNHPDLAVLAYNQGEGSVKESDIKKGRGGVKGFVKTWAERNISSTIYQDAYAQWQEENKNNKNAQFKFVYFVDYLYDHFRIDLATMLMDETTVKQFMGSRNGGSGYLSKILAMHVMAIDPEKYGIKVVPSNDNAFPAVIDNENDIAFTWYDLFAAVQMPKGTTMRDFATTNRYNLEALTFINRQVRDIDATFDVPVRIWIPRSSINEEFLAKMVGKGKPMVPEKPVVAKQASSIKNNQRKSPGKNTVVKTGKHNRKIQKLPAAKNRRSTGIRHR